MNFNNVNLVLTAGLPSQLSEKSFPQNIPHVALCGRSNVGKSSLINRMLGRNKLARVSSSPGKTITVNAYEVDKTVYLVDLPGYGYAKRSFSERESWKKLIDKYFSLDANILFFLLCDLKVGLTKDDKVMLDFLIEAELPFAVIATKADKLNKTNRTACLEKLQNDYGIPEDVVIVPFSSETGEGKDRTWEIIGEFCDFVKENS